MSNYSLGHVQDHVLLRDLAALVVRDRHTTAELLAHIAEVESRGLYRPKAYSCMHAYCVRELRMSEDMAFKRIRAARAARQFPPFFGAVADGRVSLSVLVTLAPFLDRGDPAELLAAATHRTRTHVESLLAARFPVDDVPVVLMALPASMPPIGNQMSVSGPLDSGGSAHLTGPLAPGPAAPSIVAMAHESREPLCALAHPDPLQGITNPAVPSSERPVTVATRLTPLSATRFALQVTIADATREKLRRAQELLGHAVPSGDVAQVLDRALDALIAQLEKRKYAATTEPRSPRCIANPRTIPAHVRRAVRERDGGRCAFRSDDGNRCEARKRLEFHHVVSVARGGFATVEDTSLRCRAHNQYEAECELGVRHMEGKRERAQSERQRGRAARPKAAASSASAPDRAPAATAARELSRIRSLIDAPADPPAGPHPRRPARPECVRAAPRRRPNP